MQVEERKFTVKVATIRFLPQFNYALRLDLKVQLHAKIILRDVKTKRLKYTAKQKRTIVNAIETFYS